MCNFALFLFLSPYCGHCRDMSFTADSLYLYDSLDVQAVVDSQYVEDIQSWGFHFPVIKNVNMKEEWNIDVYPQMVCYFPETTNAYVIAEGATGGKEVKNNIAKAVYLEKLFRLSQKKEKVK
ncbi:MAG: conjugal transfer protein TraF [Candidatus Zambryskibacteria bacterium]|nr:conjugal transfer protein TraF [Candidatus Zambryskibacteria bacterium]